MRKMPQDMAFPLGLGSKGSKEDNKNSRTNVHTDKENGKEPPAPVQDLDTINL